MTRRQVIFVFLIFVFPITLGFFSFRLTKNNLTGSSISKEVLPEKQELVSLIVVGDIMLSRMVAYKINLHQDINYPFLKVVDYLQTADLVFGNLECPISEGPPVDLQTMIFRADPGVEQALRKTGFSVLSLANNHTFNAGHQGLEDTFVYLDQVGIKYVGAGESSARAYEPVFVEKKKMKFAFLAYTDPVFVPLSFQDQDNSSIAVMDIERMIVGVQQARQKADIVVISLHAGNEYTDKPNQIQIEFAHAAIDAGADLVIGHHPHVIQEIEKYEGKYIFYSLGNFVFDQMWSNETRLGLVAKIFFDKTGVVKMETLPIFIDDFSQPRFPGSAESRAILEKLEIDL